MWRAVAFAVLMHLTLDFSDPNLPGALKFDADQSVDAVSTHVRGHIVAAKPSIVPVPGPLASPVETSLRVVAGIAPRPVINVVRVDLRPRGLLHWLAPASPDDH
jgi:hypothetical protein